MTSHRADGGREQAHAASAAAPANTKPRLTPEQAIDLLCAWLEPVPGASGPWSEAAGRVLESSLAADRPNPAVDVSAMDGFAIHVNGPLPECLPVVGEANIGSAPRHLPPGTALKIFTGSPIPDGANCVVRLEDVIEESGDIRFRPKSAISEGDNIRWRGENCPTGAEIVAAGQAITPAVASALAAFVSGPVSLRRRVRVRALITGNEVCRPGAAVEPWQLRDSNGPAMAAFVQSLPWAEWKGIHYAKDDLTSLSAALRGCFEDTDMLLLSGGVSVGDYDFVPDAVAAAGCEIIFHKLPIRPGKPVLAAVGHGNRVVMGLPGNPLAVLVILRRLVLPVLRRLAGFREPAPAAPMVRVTLPAEQPRDTFWYRPVRMTGNGEATLVASRGSGDLVSAAASDGFIEVLPRESGNGPWAYFPWQG